MTWQHFGWYHCDVIFVTFFKIIYQELLSSLVTILKSYFAQIALSIHEQLRRKMTLEILGYTMGRVQLWWLVSLPLEVSKLVRVWLEGVELIFWVSHGKGYNYNWWIRSLKIPSNWTSKIKNTKEKSSVQKKCFIIYYRIYS